MTKTLVKARKASRSGAGRSPAERKLEELLADGVVVIDKPSGPTSHQVTVWAKDIVGADKAAHGGTLDPRVTGVLPVGFGASVRAMDVLHHGTKEYVGVMRMHGNVDRRKLDSAVAEFTDEIFQTPPMRSAVKREQRTRRIHRLTVLEVSGRDVLFDVECDAGTYIRSLAVDMGDALAVGAHLQDLRRTRAGTLVEADAVQLHDLKDAMEAHRQGDSSAIAGMLKPMEVLLTHMPKVEVKDSTVDAVCHGANVAMPGIVTLDQDIRKGDMVAIMTLSGEGVGLGHALMDSDEIMKRSEGFAIDVSRVFMKPGTYAKGWTSPEG